MWVIAPVVLKGGTEQLAPPPWHPAPLELGISESVFRHFHSGTPPSLGPLNSIPSYQALTSLWGFVHPFTSCKEADNSVLLVDNDFHLSQYPSIPILSRLGMEQYEEEQTIKEEDVESRSIERRSFLGRFGAAVGMTGVLAWSAACGQGSSESAASDSDSSDSDSSEPAASDSDSSESDSSEPAASDPDSSDSDSSDS